MKDPHVGAFGVIYTGAVLFVQFGAWHQIFVTPKFIVPACMAFVLSRSLSGFAIIRFPKAKESGLAATFSGFAATDPSAIVLTILTVIAFVPAFFFPNWTGIFVPASAVLMFIFFYRMSKREFGGITGDLAGFFITVGETIALVLSAVLGAVI